MIFLYYLYAVLLCSIELEMLSWVLQSSLKGWVRFLNTSLRNACFKRVAIRSLVTCLFPMMLQNFFFKKCFKVLSVNIQLLLNGGIGYNCRGICRKVPQEGYGSSWETKDKEKSSLEHNQFSVARTLPFDPGFWFWFVFNPQISWPEKVWNSLT